MPKKSPAVRLTAEDRDLLEKCVAPGRTSARAMHSARLLLLLDEARSEKAIPTTLRGSRGTLPNVRTKYLPKADEPILDRLHAAPRSGRPRKIAPSVEAQVTMMAGSDPPEGAGRWTLHRIAAQLVQ